MMKVKRRNKQKTRGYFKRIYYALKNEEDRVYSMRRRLMTYLLVMTLIAFSILVIALLALEFISDSDTRIEDELKLQLRNDQRQVGTELENLVTRGLELSGNLGRETQQLLTETHMECEDLNDNPEMLEQLQEKYYGYMNTLLQVSEASGVFSIVNATTNTSVSDADDSRSCLYLRVNNIDLSDKVSKETNLYRGIPKVGRQKNLNLNNQWDLEFDTSALPEYRAMIASNTDDVVAAYRWKERTGLPNMWEEAMFLMFPFAGSDGTVYGICGLEISEALFTLLHPTIESEFGQIVTVLAPVEEDGLHLEKGLVGGTQGTYLTDCQVLKVASKNNGLTYYTGKNEIYVGIQEEFSMATEANGEDWMLCVLLPRSNYRKYVEQNRLIRILIATLFLAIMLVLAFYISRTYVQPILDGLESIWDDEMDENSRTGYSEIDDLIMLLKEKNKDQEVMETSNLPPEIRELFDRFLLNVTTLSPSESRIMELYMDGYEINEIPDALFVSLATVRKHNRSIYNKLEVASRDEMMLFIDLLRRCGRLYELREELKQKTGILEISDKSAIRL